MLLDQKIGGILGKAASPKQARSKQGKKKAQQGIGQNINDKPLVGFASLQIVGVQPRPSRGC